MEEWRARILCTEPSPRPLVEAAIRAHYRLSNEDEPERFVWVESPLTLALVTSWLNRTGAGRWDGDHDDHDTYAYQHMATTAAGALRRTAGRYPKHDEAVRRVRRRLERLCPNVHPSWQPTLARLADVAVVKAFARRVLDAPSSRFGRWAQKAYRPDVEALLDEGLGGMGSGGVRQSLLHEHGRPMTAAVRRATLHALRTTVGREVPLEPTQRLTHSELVGSGCDGGRWAAELALCVGHTPPTGDTTAALDAQIQSCEAWHWFAFERLALVSERPLDAAQRDGRYRLTWADGWSAFADREPEPEDELASGDTPSS